MKGQRLFYLFMFFSIKNLIPVYSQETGSSTTNQNYTDSILKENKHLLPKIFEADNTLKLIASFFPENWKINVTNDTITILCISPLYRINKHSASDTVRIGKSFLKDTMPRTFETAMIKIRTEPLWSVKKIEEARYFNARTQEKIDNLIIRFKITHLREIINEPDFVLDKYDFTDFEKKSIIRYFKERNILESALIKIPDYHSANFSLFIEEILPQSDNNDIFHPVWVINSRTEILNIFEKYAGK